MVVLYLNFNLSYLLVVISHAEAVEEIRDALNEGRLARNTSSGLKGDVAAHFLLFMIMDRFSCVKSKLEDLRHL